MITYLTNRNLWFSTLLCSSNPLSRKSGMEYGNNLEMYIPYAGAVRMFIQIKGNFTMGRLKITNTYDGPDFR
jgi:hypothetical protein